MTDFNFYHSLDEKGKEMLRSLMPNGWKPPVDKWEDIAKIMKQKPKQKRDSRW
ncbi:hypothetical protein LCGC14_1953610 [marine sediment metagenome]|uniref:Uncharacterized protein n=1 Tax=marine sediment metagenome TaxID=412755 RepID=A0A0F9FGM6_9ZZZZ